MISKGERWDYVFHDGSDYEVAVVDADGYLRESIASGMDRVTAHHLSKLPEFMDEVEAIINLALAGALDNREQERLVEAVQRRLGDFRTGRGA